MTRRIIQIIVLCVLLGSTAFAHAGGPFAVDTGKNGIALRWANDTLPWYLDKGPMSASVSNEVGKEWVEEQLQKWNDIKIKNADLNSVTTATFSSEYKGKLDEDVDADNFGSYISTSSGPSAVIFDYDGGITAALMGSANKENIVGLSAPLLADSSGKYITKGFALFNGHVLEGDNLAQDWDTKEKLFKTTVLHELGHLINLDHAQVNNAIAQKCANQGTVFQRNGYCENGQYIPTMYPELLSTLQQNLSRDDKVTLSWIYPSDSFKSDFCTIVGAVYDSDGKPLKGVNVIAARVGEGEGMTYQDKRAFVSGAMYPDCYGDSKYYLHGIVPGKKYQVTFEPLDKDYSGASGFEPLDDPPSDFDSNTINDPSGNTTVMCDEGGETIEMASATVPATNPCPNMTVTGDDGTGGDTTGDAGDSSAPSSGGCSLLESRNDSSIPVSAILFLFAAMAVVIYRRKAVVVFRRK